MGFDASKYVSEGFLNASIVKEMKLQMKPIAILNVEEKPFPDHAGSSEMVQKLVLTLDKVDKQFVLNSTNNKILIEKFGKDTDAWIGKIIYLVVVKSNYKGSSVDSVQISTEGG